MSDRLNAGLADGMVRCPNCRAAQDWSDACRRCKSDLRLLRSFADAYDRSRGTCLAAIRSGDPGSASHHARRCHALAPGPDSRGLLALAALLRGDWPTAAELASHDP